MVHWSFHPVIFNVYSPTEPRLSIRDVHLGTDRLSVQQPVFIAIPLPLGSGLILHQPLFSCVYVQHSSTAISPAHPSPPHSLRLPLQLMVSHFKMEILGKLRVVIKLSHLATVTDKTSFKHVMRWQQFEWHKQNTNGREQAEGVRWEGVPAVILASYLHLNASLYCFRWSASHQRRTGPPTSCHVSNSLKGSNTFTEMHFSGDCGCAFYSNMPLTNLTITIIANRESIKTIEMKVIKTFLITQAQWNHRL